MTDTENKLSDIRYVLDTRLGNNSLLYTKDKQGNVIHIVDLVGEFIKAKEEALNALINAENTINYMELSSLQLDLMADCLVNLRALWASETNHAEVAYDIDGLGDTLRDLIWDTIWALDEIRFFDFNEHCDRYSEYEPGTTLMMLKDVDFDTYNETKNLSDDDRYAIKKAIQYMVNILFDYEEISNRIRSIRTLVLSLKSIIKH